MNITKAIIPVASLGTRMLPATKSIPKEMLPVFDKPLIQYVVEEAVSAGIKDIILITRSGKSAIDNHFNVNAELETLLAQKGKQDLLAAIKSGVPRNVSICSITQQEALGLGHAILCAKSIIGNEPFSVLLPDVLIDEHFCSLSEANLATMIRRFEKTSRNQVLVEPVPLDKIHQYGIVDCEGVSLREGEARPVKKLIEKPNKLEAPSNLSIVGRYVFDKAIWKHLSRVKPDASGEIQLTNAINSLAKKEIVEAYHIVGRSHDCGNKCGYAKAGLAYAMRDHLVGRHIEEYMHEVMLLKQKNNFLHVVNA